MIGFNHTLVGAIVGLTLKQPLLIAPVAFASHFVCDSLPHFAHEDLQPWTKGLIQLLIFDAVVCFSILAVTLMIWPHLWLSLVTGMAFATLPDFLWIYAHTQHKQKLAFFRFHKWIQWGERPYGWIYEAIYTSLFVLVLARLR